DPATKQQDWTALLDTIPHTPSTTPNAPPTRTPPPSDATRADISSQASAILQGRFGRSLPEIKARAKRGEQDEDPCLAAPDARLRGEENQLYRVEIHDGGDSATFKWDRDNGSVTFQIIKTTQAPGASTFTVEIASLGRDARSSLTPGNWVELIDDR